MTSPASSTNWGSTRAPEPSFSRATTAWVTEGVRVRTNVPLGTPQIESTASCATRGTIPECDPIDRRHFCSVLKGDHGDERSSRHVDHARHDGFGPLCARHKGLEAGAVGHRYRRA